jgi:hypothetical protein
VIVGIGGRARGEPGQTRGSGNERTQQREVVFDAKLGSSLRSAVGAEASRQFCAIETAVVGKADQSNGRRCEAVAREDRVAVRVRNEERTDDALQRRQIQLVQR